jgi:DNA-binding NarL/FixJ family response regulator
VLSLWAVCVQLDPHPIVHATMGQLLSRLGVSLTTATTSTRTALRAIGLQHPDLFVIDPALPDGEPMGGLECIRSARQADPGVTVFALSAVDDAVWRRAVLAAGAVAFVPKSAPIVSIEEAITDALEQARCGEGPLRSRLTPREQEILALVAENRTNTEVAQVLWLSRETVKFHLANVYTKLDVSSRSAAARWARRHGLAAPPARIAQPPLWTPQPISRRRSRDGTRGRRGAPARRPSGHHHV